MDGTHFIISSSYFVLLQQLYWSSGVAMSLAKMKMSVRSSSKDGWWMTIVSILPCQWLYPTFLTKQRWESMIKTLQEWTTETTL